MSKIPAREFINACRYSDLETLKRDISKVSDINEPIDSSLNRLLHTAAWHGNLEVTKYLIENGADMYISNKKGNLPMHVAISGGKVEIVKLLIEKGQDLNYHSSSCGLPLHFAVLMDKTEIVKLLIDNGANKDLKGGVNNETALQLARELAKLTGNNDVYDIIKKTEIRFDNCAVCEDERGSDLFALVPCLHANLCENCCKKILNSNNPKCPTCRVDVSRFQKVFY